MKLLLHIANSTDKPAMRVSPSFLPLWICSKLIFFYFL
jgi:hypothetical protein